MKNICVCGYGSVGKKHGHALKNLKRDFDIIDINCESTGSYDKEYDLVLICTPTAYHISEAEKFINTKSFLIEKSFDSDLEKIIKAKSFFENKDVYVGYNLRYTDFYRELDNCLFEYDGYVKFINVFYSGNLLNWRPGVDPKECYSYNKNLGGGIIADVSHEFDYIYNILGKPNKSQFISRRVSGITIDCDDYCVAIWEYDNFIVKFELKTFSKPERYCEVLIRDSHEKLYEFKYKIDDLDIFGSYYFQLKAILNRSVKPQNYDDIITFNKLIMEDKI